MNIFKKIDEGTVTVDDFNKLISEATPESVRDRLRRRPMAQRRTVKSHQDEEGHSDLKQPKFSDRIDPKREREGRTQMDGRGRQGHRHSARTQKKTMSKSLGESRFMKAAQYIKENYGKPPKIEDIEDRVAVIAVARKMMAKPDVDRDWFESVIKTVREDFDEYEGLDDEDTFQNGHVSCDNCAVQYSGIDSFQLWLCECGHHFCDKCIPGGDYFRHGDDERAHKYRAGFHVDDEPGRLLHCPFCPDTIKTVREDFDEYEGLDDEDTFESGPEPNTTIWSDDTLSMFTSVSDALAIEPLELFKMLGVELPPSLQKLLPFKSCGDCPECEGCGDYLGDVVSEVWYDIMSAFHHKSHKYSLEGPHSASGDMEVLDIIEPENDNALGRAIDEAIEAALGNY